MYNIKFAINAAMAKRISTFLWGLEHLQQCRLLWEE
jgi:hypothetical protein